MEEIRSESNHHVVHNPWDSKESDLKAEEVKHYLADTGGVQSHRIIRQIACHCGCIKPAAGFCSCCKGIICASCFTRCLVCSKPIGPCCSVVIQDANCRIIRLCKECHSASKRKKALKFSFRLLLAPFILLLSPFVKFEK